MSMSTSIDDMLVADLPPFDVKLSKKMLSLLGMEAQPLPKKLVADKREKLHTPDGLYMAKDHKNARRSAQQRRGHDFI